MLKDINGDKASWVPGVSKVTFTLSFPFRAKHQNVQVQSKSLKTKPDEAADAY